MDGMKSMDHEELDSFRVDEMSKHDGVGALY